MPLVSFYTPWKHQKTRGFLMFPRGIEKDKWHEMGWGFLERCNIAWEDFKTIVFRYFETVSERLYHLKVQLVS